MLSAGCMLLLFEIFLLLPFVMGGREYYTAMSPPILQEHDSLYLHGGEDYFLYCTASGQPRPSIQLWRDEAQYETKRHKLNHANPDTAYYKLDVKDGVYQLEAENTHGTARSDNIIIRRLDIRTTFELLPDGHGVVACGAVVDVTHLSRTYTWKKNTERVSVSDKHYIDVHGGLHILNVDRLDGGNYYCTITITDQNLTVTSNSTRIPFQTHVANPNRTASNNTAAVSSVKNVTQTASVLSSGIHTSTTPTHTASVHSLRINTFTTPTQTSSVLSSAIHTSTTPTQKASVHGSRIHTSTTTSSIHGPEMYTSAIKPTQTASIHSSVHYTKNMDSTTQHSWPQSPTMTPLGDATRVTPSAPTKQPDKNRGPDTIMLTKQRTYTYGDNLTIECLCNGLLNNTLPNVSWIVPESVKKKMDIRSDKYHRRLVIANVQHNAAGIYHCSCHNSSFRSINITVKANFMWVTKPIPVVVMAGDTARFICDAQWSDNKARNRTITWYRNYDPIPNENGTMIEFRNVNRKRDIRNIQCRTESENRSLYFNSYLQVIEPMELSEERTNISISADSGSIGLKVQLVTDPYMNSSTSWAHIPENADVSETLDVKGSIHLVRHTDNSTRWEMLLGTYIFTVENEYEHESIRFYVSRKYLDPPEKPIYYLGEILGLVTVGTVLIIVCILYKEREWLKKKWQKRKLEQSIKFRLELSKYNHASRYVKFPAYSDEFPIDRLHFLDTLGSGNFGKVMKAEALNVTGTGKWDLVAVKMCKDIATDAEKENLYHETVIMRKVPSHINVVTYLGYVASSDPSLLIMEYVPGGNLLQFLRNRRPQKVKGDEDVAGDGTSGEREEPGQDEGGQKSEGNDALEQMNILSSRDLSSFALQIAKGMAHIASQNIIHRDLAARNVLLGLGNVCKISDFGLSRDMEGSEEYEVSTMGPLPIRWMPPESLTDRLYTLKSDVWSYGVLLWETVTLGASPYSGLSARQVMMSVKEGKRLEKPDYCSEHVYKLMTQCWRPHPGDRPTFSKLAETIEQHLEEEAEYVQLSNFDVNIYDVIDMGGMDVMEEKV